MGDFPDGTPKPDQESTSGESNQPTTPSPRPVQLQRLNSARWRPTALVAAVIAVVVVGGLAANTVLPAPSAGTQDIGGVTITAAPGWVLTSAPGDNSAGIVLQKGDATLTAQVLSRSYSGSSSSVMAQVRQQLSSQVAQISYGDEHESIIAGNDSASVLFEAILSGSEGSSSHMGTVDGELVCMIVSGNAVVVEVAAPQGDLQYVTDDISAMVKTVRAA